jgi:hypothetical protein
MNHAQKQLVLSGAAVAAILALAAAQEITSRPGANCRDEIKSFDRRGRWVTMKSRVCE